MFQENCSAKLKALLHMTFMDNSERGDKHVKRSTGAVKTVLFKMGKLVIRRHKYRIAAISFNNTEHQCKITLQILDQMCNQIQLTLFNNSLQFWGQLYCVAFLAKN